MSHLDRQSIVAFLADRYRTVSLSYEEHIARERPRVAGRELEKYDEKTARLAGQVFILRTLVAQIERCDDVETV